MSKRKKTDDEETDDQYCCVCVKRTTRNFTYISEYYHKKKQSQKYNSDNENLVTYFDVLENLEVLSYKISDAENTIICNQCKKTTIDFFEFKILNENYQKKAKLPAKYAQMDSIKKYLSAHNYDALKKYVVKNVVESVEITEQNEFKLVPLRREFKTESVDVFPDPCFVDPAKVLVKIEEQVANSTERAFDDAMSDNLEMADKNSHAESTDDSNEDVKEEDSEDEMFGTSPCEEDEGITKTVSDNVQFISRVPSCLIGLDSRLEELKKKSTRVPNVKSWRRIVQREAKLRGHAYISKGGQEIRARQLQPPCDKKKCRFLCQQKIGPADRQTNFDNHWNLADFALQKKFLFEHRKCVPVARRRARKNDTGVKKTRAYSTKYYLDTFNEDGSIKSQEQVCETMFCATFDICKNNLRYLRKKILTGKVQDMRGSNKREPTPGHLVAIEHAQKYPHFHIDQQLTIRQIFKEYLKICEERSVKPVLENTFRKVFSEYNETDFLREERRKAKCETCYQYYNSTLEQKAALKHDFDYHISMNKHCKSRLRWRRNFERKKERERLSKEKQNVDKSQFKQQEQIPTMSDQQMIENFDEEMNFM